MASPLISVIIPTYNRAEMVVRAVQSVFMQTFSDLEVIVVDDGGGDDTGPLLRKYYHDRIRYVRVEQNRGLASARNTGIYAARGEYLAFLDDDDTWLPEKLALQVRLLHANPSAGLVYCGYVEVDAAGTVLREIQPCKKGNVFDALLYENHITGSASAVLMYKDLLQRTGYFDESLSACEDWDLWLRVARHAAVDFVDAPLVRCVVHAGSMHKDIDRMERNTFRMLDKYRELIPAPHRQKVFSGHCSIFAWQYFASGNRQAFARLLTKALEYLPLTRIFIHGEDVADREAAVFEVFAAFWIRQQQYPSSLRRQAYAQQYLQLAWEYYHQNDLRGFRRCTACVFRYASPVVSLRLCVPFLKSFLGKNTADRLHAARKKMIPGPQEGGRTP